VQINPIWLWGPYHVASGTNGAQPDWYLGWLIGALRLVPGFDVTIGTYTLVPNPFWGGALLPMLVFGFLFLFPWAERRLTGDRAFHNLLDRPRDAPWRTAIGAAVFTWAALIFLAGSADRVFVTFFVSYGWQILIFRIAVWVVPVLVLVVTRRVCLELQASERVELERELAEEEARRAAAVEPVR
jgi:ubiquinol-cytochrome c reductase cytochrome b subunit